ncbi:hypothetical protein C900_04484 [Fulvivirga imtechensis AK7]|uniref:Uncharacterized protein n=1 Tax=Fulvivirga imtechensis AK7 TaxID=1237149 RepID=L8JLZ8_9BACT|nr:hypothetical protein [Fulvivirga imtechensis]ELR69961.1 hypothetical protein C900_04484 [Fulvivirga imtechensis AK7]
MSKKDPGKKKKQKEKPKVNPELEGFDIKINSFGEIQTNFNIDKINEFLNKNVEDKKLAEREDYDELKSKKKKDPDEDE